MITGLLQTSREHVGGSTNRVTMVPNCSVHVSSSGPAADRPPAGNQVWYKIVIIYHHKHLLIFCGFILYLLSSLLMNEAYKPRSAARVVLETIVSHRNQSSWKLSSWFSIVFPHVCLNHWKKPFKILQLPEDLRVKDLILTIASMKPSRCLQYSDSVIDPLRSRAHKLEFPWIQCHAETLLFRCHRRPVDIATPHASAKTWRVQPAGLPGTRYPPWNYPPKKLPISPTVWHVWRLLSFPQVGYVSFREVIIAPETLGLEDKLAW